jgi:hypothetical protein
METADDAVAEDNVTPMADAEREIMDYETVVVVCTHSGCKWQEDVDFSERRAARQRGWQHWEQEHGPSAQDAP